MAYCNNNNNKQAKCHLPNQTNLTKSTGHRERKDNNQNGKTKATSCFNDNNNNNNNNDNDDNNNNNSAVVATTIIIMKITK